MSKNNIYEQYKEKILNNENYTDAKKKQYLERIKILETKNSEIILNTYHFSNLVGIKWKVLKKIINSPDKFYYNFQISKKMGGKRTINVPNSSLELCQKYIKVKILDNIELHSSAHGFVNSKSIITNAKEHVNNEMILNIDLKDFFSSISRKKVFYVFNGICGYDNSLSHCLTKLVMYKNGLPQGACTSPIISNIVTFKLDLRLKKLSDKLGINYSRYADDITFSGNKNIINSKLLFFVKSIINECGYQINDKKTRFESKYGRQEVTGLIVNNGKVSIPKQYIQNLRKDLYYIKKYGIEEHKKRNNIYNAFYQEHIKGQIMFVYSVDKNKGMKLLNEYNLIFENTNKVN